MRSDKRGLRGAIESIPDAAPAGVYFSQFGEDVVLWHYLQHVKGGFYVDVGAHDPYRFSNTYLLYKYRGWSGINIDLDERSVRAFAGSRPTDTNLQIGVSDYVGALSATRFADGAINSADSQMLARHGKQKVLGVSEIAVTTLAAVLGTHIPPDRQCVDLLSIDVEGLDLAVLSGNDWARFRPRYIAVEDHKMNLAKAEQSEIFQFLDAKGYRLKSHLVVTSIYLLR